MARDVRFVDGPWETPRSDLSPEDYCAVCLIDLNPPGAPKVKARCKLPIRKRPGGPIYRNALRNAASRIFQMTDVPREERRRAARRLVRLMRMAGISVGESLLRLAGMR